VIGEVGLSNGDGVRGDEFFLVLSNGEGADRANGIGVDLSESDGAVW
jgi:hypothetical protein